MSLHARASLAVVLAFAAAIWSGESYAGNRPAETCRPMAHLPGELWLGHFTGGRRISGAGIDWRDEYGCFTSRAACRNWWNGLNRTYRHIEGHGTCMALRGGGQVIAKKTVKHRTVVRARY